MSKKNSRDLINPFEIGEEILIPAGSKFWSTAPWLEGKQISTWQQWIVADYIDGAEQDRFIHEPEIGYKTPNGDIKTFVLSKKILEANNKPVRYVEETRVPARK